MSKLDLEKTPTSAAFEVSFASERICLLGVCLVVNRLPWALVRSCKRSAFGMLRESVSGSPNNRCKGHHQLLSAARRRNACANRKLPWRVSEAFTRWSSNFGLFGNRLLAIIVGMAVIFVFPESNSSRIRPKKWAFLLKDPKIGPNSR